LTKRPFDGIGSVVPAETLLLHDIFDSVALRYPDNIALDIPPGPSRPNRAMVTYSQLQRHADAMAAALRPLVRPDAIVAILLPRDAPALYAAQLAVLKSGAAFTCIDPIFPDEHLRAVLDDSDAVAIITNSCGRKRTEAAGAPAPAFIDPDAPAPYVNGTPVLRASGSNLAYVIYTSGTTGKPKGVLIEHRSIVNLVLSDVPHFNLTPADRVAQCSSPAYDSSIEETWFAFAVGATLVPMDDHVVRLGPDLVPWLRRERLTVVCPPPTLLRTAVCDDPQRELPDLKLLYVGGEPLTPDLVERWAPGRWMENGYGPTECAVTTTHGRMFPGEPVSIGNPIPNCDAWILDESLSPVADGESGELCVGGVLLARGYHKLHDLTNQKFPTHPRLGRIYRTGDLVRRNDNGDLEFLGRIDGQVKVRGYRIELPAIEAKLAASPGVRAAACTTQGDGAAQTLVAFVVPHAPQDPPSVESLKQSLRRSLPEYMVPARFGFLEALPRTVGGKLDRKALPVLAAAAGHNGRKIIAPRTPREQAIAAAFAKALKLPGEFSVHDDFFLDLGGDSLAVVGVILELRAAANDSNLAVRDLYEARTVARLAELDPRAVAQPISPKAAPAPRPRGDPTVSTLIQCLWIAIELVIGSAAVYAAVFGLLPFMLRNYGVVRSAMLLPFLSLIALLAYIPLSLAITVILKRVLIGRYRTMTTPVWSGFFTRHWIVIQSARLIPWWLLQGTVFASAVLRALGAQVGSRVHIHRGVDLARGGWDLLSIGDDVTLAQDAALRVVDLDDGQLVVGPISIGSGATVDVRAGLSPNSAIEANGLLTPLSWLQSGDCISEGSRWDGVPAAPAGHAPPRPAVTRGRDLPPLLHGSLMLLGRCGSLLVAEIFAVLIAFLAPLFFPQTRSLLSWLADPDATARGIGIIVLLTALWVTLTLLLQALAMRILGRVEPGVVSQWSSDAFRIWTKTGIAESAGRWLSGSLFWTWWLRLAGMHIGRGCEISTIIDVLPENIRIGRESFFADGIYLCAPWRHRGTITVAPSTLGRGTFLGNHAVIPAGHTWPDQLFVAVSTMPDPRRTQPNSAWFGHPPMQLPRREVAVADRRVTFNPGIVLYATRLFWESLRFFLPVLPILLGCGWYLALSAAAAHFSFAVVSLLIAPLLTAAAAVTMCLSIVAAKWILLGRMKPKLHPFWSCWCGRWDFLFMVWENWGGATLATVSETLLLNVFLRLTGVRIGRRVVLDRGFSQVVDPDMLAFEDDSTVTCHFQTHSFEDRVLKLAPIRIGRGATVGHNAVVFYGADIGHGAHVSPHSVVMKRDILQPHARYAGVPTRPTE